MRIKEIGSISQRLIRFVFKLNSDDLSGYRMRQFHFTILKADFGWLPVSISIVVLENDTLNSPV